LLPSDTACTRLQLTGVGNRARKPEKCSGTIDKDELPVPWSGWFEWRCVFGKPYIHQGFCSVGGGEVVVAHAVFEIFRAEVYKKAVLIVIATCYAINDIGNARL
jgi:hypothetical protein